MSDDRPTNRLARETSPYLLQHQHNPVDWYPWGSEAFETARAQEKLVLLSVGYSACHWCHVMERESFEDEATAAVMNALYVPIKVDREERPDVDHVYMQFVQATTGHGGWPMTVFLTPDAVPIFGGTYFPPDDRHGLPGFARVLRAVAETYLRKPEDLEETGRDLMQRLVRGERPSLGDAELTPDIGEAAFATLSRTFDARYGGLDRAPKFPQPMTWDWLLRYWARTHSERAREMVATTLTHMARGGMYDQLGGGFHRYSVDGEWLVPHFEKMLYDNAQLARLYVDAYLALGDPEYRRIAEETLDYLVREMRHPSGGFFSAQDADSEGEEGKFFVWDPEEIDAVLGGGDLAEAAKAYWGVTGRPNFEGAWILHVPRQAAAVARGLQVEEEQLLRRVTEACARLATARELRVHPGRDDKVLAAWNGMTVRAFAEAGRALGRADYLEVARQGGEFLLGSMRRPDGRLLRTWKDGEARLLGYLEDYAHALDAVLALAFATLEAKWLRSARELAESLVDLFWNEAEGGLYDTGKDAEPLLVRPRDTFDSATPCGSSAAADALLRLAAVTGESRWEEYAMRTLRAQVPMMGQYPGGAGRFLSALEFGLGPVAEVALVWPEGKGPEALLTTVFGRYLPNRVVAGKREGEERSGEPLLEGRGVVEGKVTAYVCRQFVCERPTTEPAELEVQLYGPTST